MATYGYVRVSTVEQASGTSPETQTRQIEGAAQVLGVAVDGWYNDLGVSGAAPFAQRPSGQQLAEILQPGDKVIAAKLDRMFRDASDALATAKLFRERGVKLVLIDMGLTPVTDAGTAKLLFGILASVAEMERERIAERTRQGREAKRAAGGAVGGKTPYGYRKVGAGKESKLEPDPAQQEVIASIRVADSAGMSLRQILAYVLARHGTAPSLPTISRIVKEGKA